MVRGNLWKLFKTQGKRWDISKLAIPPFKVMLFCTLISDVVCDQFGPTKVRAPKKLFFLISIEGSVTKGSADAPCYPQVIKHGNGKRTMEIGDVPS